MKIHKVIIEVSSDDAVKAVNYPHKWPIYRNILDVIHKSLKNLTDWQIQSVSWESNQCAGKITQSVTDDRRYQSYIARGGPSWLQDLLIKEAAV
ncbi:hypothetical protein V5N11_017417 [Cardamine amara subsp. amara]|uniref:RNase H type-1 domain-containing protein n=1 Tax=Cardamine amara subsp. amara TaxID=228776 RepID=A0ABD1AT81_CARAN